MGFGATAFNIRVLAKAQKKDAGLFAKVSKLIDEDNKLSELSKISLKKYEDEMAKLKKLIAGHYKELKADFLAETEESNADDFKDKLDTAFDTMLSDDLRQEIIDECGFDESDDDELAIADRMYNELKREFARLALG